MDYIKIYASFKAVDKDLQNRVLVTQNFLGDRPVYKLR